MDDTPPLPFPSEAALRPGMQPLQLDPTTSEPPPVPQKPYKRFPKTSRRVTGNSPFLRRLRSNTHLPTLNRRPQTNISDSAFSRFSMATSRQGYDDLTFARQSFNPDLESRHSVAEFIILKNSAFHNNLDIVANHSIAIDNNGVDKEDPLRYALTYMVVLGVASLTRIALSNYSPRDWIEYLKSFKLEGIDFILESTTSFPPEGNAELKLPKHSFRKFKFVEYAPMVFKKLRFLHDVTEQQFREEMLEHSDLVEFQTTSKSGSFFFHTVRGSFIVKSQSKFETDVLIQMLPGYYQYMLHNPNSMLTRYLGLYHIESPDAPNKKTYFVVMKSVYSYSERNQLKMHHVYDLKGSTVGRKTDDPDKVQKDLNIKDDITEGKIRKIDLGVATELFAQQLLSDTKFLQSYNIMDYSLLLGIHDPQVQDGMMSFDVNRMTRVRGNVLRDKHRTMTGALLSSVRAQIDSPGTPTGALSVITSTINRNYPATGVPTPKFAVFRSPSQPNEQYFMGIIDILQPYTWKKFAETKFKSLFKDGRQISSVRSKFYKDRFEGFLFDEVIENIQRKNVGNR